MSFMNESFSLDLLTYWFIYYISIIIEFMHKYLLKYSTINAKLMQAKLANFSQNMNKKHEDHLLMYLNF